MARLSVAAMLVSLVLFHGAIVSARPVLIRNGRLITVTKGVVPVGDLLLENGKIKALGKGLTAPPGALIIDARNRWVTPGLVESHSHLGVHAMPSVVANYDGNERSDPVTPHVRVIDSVNIADPALKWTLQGGVTTVQILPGSSNVIGGQSLVVKLRGGTIGTMWFREAPRGLKMAIGENPKRSYRGKLPSTRMGIAWVMRKAFGDAKRYLELRQRWQKAPRRTRGPAPKRDLKLEVLADVLQGKLRVHAHCYRVDGMQMLLRVADEFGFKITSFQHALEAYKIPGLIARRKIGVATFADLWGYKFEAYQGSVRNAQILAKHGVRVAIHTDHPVIEQRWLIHEAAKAMKYGLSRENAWRAVTINPAWILGVDHLVGSLEVGKHGDVVIWDRDPFLIGARVQWVFIDGKAVYQRTPGGAK